MVGKEKCPECWFCEQGGAVCQRGKGLQTQCKQRGQSRGLRNVGWGEGKTLENSNWCGRHPLHLLIENLLFDLSQLWGEVFWPNIRQTKHTWVRVPEETSWVSNRNITLHRMSWGQAFSLGKINNLLCPVVQGKEEAQVLSFTYFIPRRQPVTG